jgi:hypothetical protein
VHWWKYVGVALQADMRHDKMVDQIVGAGKAKAVALGNYLSFAGGLTPVVQLAVVTAIMPGVMLYAAPVWGGVCVETGATERDMDRLSSVWDGVLRSVFGCAKLKSQQPTLTHRTQHVRNCAGSNTKIKGVHQTAEGPCDR